MSSILGTTTAKAPMTISLTKTVFADGTGGGTPVFATWLNNFQDQVIALIADYVSKNGGNTILVPTDGTDAIKIQFQVGSTGNSFTALDHNGSPIFGSAAVGGFAIFGDKFRAGPSVTGTNFVTLDGTTTPPSVGFAPTNAPHRLWFGSGTPASVITIGTTQVNDLYWNWGGGAWYVCTASGTPGTWVPWSTEYKPTPQKVGSITGATTIDWSQGPRWKGILTGNITFTFSNPVDQAEYKLTLQQDNTGSRTVTWPASVVWPAGSAPTLTTTANFFDRVTLTYDADQSKYRGTFTLNYAS